LSAAHLAKLNDEQRLAAHAIGGPLLVIAGAGSGKTATLAHRVAHLIVAGADPRRILLMTFSRRAASELISRVKRICAEALCAEALGPKSATLADALGWAGTFHGIGARLLREYADEIGLDESFTIHDREDSADLLNLARHDLGYSKTASRFPTKGTCLAIYSRAVNSEAPLDEVLAKSFPWCAGWSAELRKLFAAYVEAKQAQNVLDYDDLLLYWAQMAAEPELARRMGEKFDHVLVDEYQDTNRLQASILAGLKPDGKGLTVVGDDAQSIYAFRAASVRNILDFPNQFSPPARVVTLERNYRSTQPILAAANGVIALAAERFAKNLWTDRKSSELPRLVTVRDEADQAAYIVEQVLAARENGRELKKQAVLFRAAHHSGPLEVELTRRNIPFVKFGGLKFLDSAHVKDLLALLRFAQNPRDRVAGFRLLQLMPGVGPAGARKTLDAMAESADPLAALAALPAPAKAESHWPDFVAAMRGLRENASPWPADIFVARLWLEPLLELRHDDAATRKLDLVQLEQIAATYPSREKFLTELTLDPPDATSDEAGPPLRDEDYLILSTIHSAKGQEWSDVFLLNMVDGCIPSDLATGTAAEIEEERRLLYVAMTRARDRLHLMTPQRFFIHGQSAYGDRHVLAARSRFIPAELTPLFEMTVWPRASAEASARGARPQTRVDLGAKMRDFWR
jgi:DNA helicase II / ATP-dependent DNA helicase PcrA